MNEVPTAVAETIERLAKGNVAVLCNLLPLFVGDDSKPPDAATLEKLERWRGELAQAKAVLDWLNEQVKV